MPTVSYVIYSDFYTYIGRTLHPNSLTNAQHSKNSFAWDNYAPSVFIVELQKI